MKYMLMKNFGFREDDIRLMTDDKGGQFRPTKKNIFYGFQWLVEGARAGDRLWLHFSGRLSTGVLKGWPLEMELRNSICWLRTCKTCWCAVAVHAAGRYSL